MSTRQGKTILLENVLQDAIHQAEANIEEKNPSLENKKKVAEQVGVGAIIFHDLKQDRKNDVVFSLADMLTFEGNTAPYLQYAYARAISLLEKGDFDLDSASIELDDPFAWSTVKLLRLFPEVVEKAYTEYDPSKLAKYLLDVAKAFNKYYAGTKILQGNQRNERLTLVYGVTIILKEGLFLLGIQAPEKM